MKVFALSVLKLPKWCTTGRTTNWDQLKTYFGLWDFEDELNWESDSSQSDAIAEELAEDEGGL